MKKSSTFKSAFVGLSCLLYVVMEHVSGAPINIWTHHNDNSRTGANLQEIFLAPSNVNSTQFGKLYTVAVDDQIYAQPLYISNVSIPNQGKRNVVYVCTMSNSVYAFDADNNGVQYWKKSFGTPVTPIDVTGSDTNIAHGTHIGIESAPVIDLNTNTLYFLSRNEQGSGSGATFTQWLNALDLSTGNPKFGSPVQIQATSTTVDGTITFDPKVQNQRSGLTLANGNIYIGWASHGDQGGYHGWVMSYSAGNLAQQAVYSDTTSKGSKGGIWQAGQPFTIDASGNIYISTGNGSFGASPGGVTQTGNSFVKLSPTLQLLDYFTPYNSATLNAGDQDLGASGLLNIPGTNFITGGGKQGVLYLVDTANMGHFNSSQDNVLQEFQAIFGTGSSHIHGTPIYMNTDAHGPLIYVWGENDHLRAFQFSSNRFVTTPLAQSTMTAPVTNANGAMPGGFMSISANGTQDGIVWASTPYNASALHNTVEGILHAFNADTLAELWNDKQVESRDEVGLFAKNVPPIVANGKVFVATFGPLGSPDGVGALNVYGELTLIPDGDYTLTSVNSGLLFDVPGGSTQQGIVLDQAAADGLTQQLWHVTNKGGNVIVLTSKLSNQVADNKGASTQPSTPIVQWPSNGGSNQQWRVTEVADGIYTLLNLKSGFLIDVTGASKAPGALLNQYPPNTNANQQWVFTPVSATSPWAYLKFDESSGTTASDSSGNDWNGTLVNGPTWTTGHSGNAVHLNGGNQYVSLPSGLVDNFGDFTVAAWVNLNSVGVWSRVFDIGNGTANAIFLTTKNSNGVVQFAIKANSNEQDINGTAPLPTGGWHRVAVTLAGNVGTIYVDGVAVATNTNITLKPLNMGTATQCYIGKSQFSSDPYLDGSVDEFRIYNAALSASQVAALP